MPDLLPPQSGLVIDGVLFRYTTIKDPNADLLVTIRNKDNDAVGYIYTHTDDWSGLPGNTIVGYDPLGGILGTRFGDGEIVTEGEGEVTDATVRYRYRYDTCAVPLDDPRCPGFEQALYDYLLENGLLSNPDFNDPYYNEWVQRQLEQEVNVEEEQVVMEEDVGEESELEQQLDAKTSIAELAGTINQAEVILQMGSVPAFEQYYATSIPGGTYQDVLVLVDSQLPDNGSVLRSLANDANHRAMVRSQYENNNGEN